LEIRPRSRGGAVAVGDSTRNLVYMTAASRDRHSQRSRAIRRFTRGTGRPASGRCRRRRPAPDPRAFAAAVFEPVADRMLLWGGICYAWAWRIDAWATRPGPGTFSNLANGTSTIVSGARRLLTARFQLAIQYGGAAAEPEEGFLGVSLHAFSDLPDMFISKQMGTPARSPRQGGVALAGGSGSDVLRVSEPRPSRGRRDLGGKWDDASVQAFTACNGKSPGPRVRQERLHLTSTSRWCSMAWSSIRPRPGA
jgi:hypothetical protein